MNTSRTSQQPFIRPPRRLFVAAAFAVVTLFAAAVPSPAAFAQTTPARAESRKAAARYVCPMHADVVSDAPGKCPKCAMRLRAVRDEKPAAARSARPETQARAVGVGASETGDRVAKMSIPDVEVVDQDGRRLRFYTDLVRGKTVAINFIFTTCTTICPPLAATFARVQRDLRAGAGPDVLLISVSVDPATDTPARMKDYLAKFKAAEGWLFVSGDKPQIDTLLQALGAATSRPEDHAPAVLIGNDAAGRWTRTYGLASPSKLIEIIKATAGGNPAPAAK